MCEPLIQFKSNPDLLPSSQFERTPLRDAVEYRPIEDERRSRSVRQVHGYHFQYQYQPSLTSSVHSRYGPPSKYDAYQIPHHGQNVEPEPFRTGSKYQQLVDISASPEIFQNQGQLFDVYQLSSDALKLPVLDFQPSFADLRQNEEKLVFCYFTNWAFYRKTEGKFVPENIDPSLCTHVIYSFSSLEADTLLMKEFDPWADVENGKTKKSQIPF